MRCYGVAIVSLMRDRLATAIDEHLNEWDEQDRAALAALLAPFAAGRPLGQTDGRSRYFDLVTPRPSPSPIR